MNAPRRTTHPLRQHGSAAVPFVAALPVMIGLMALALDLSYMYARKSSLQQVADGIALAAASQLNGTKAGVSNAVLKSYTVAKDSFYDLNLQALILWDPAALQLATRPDAPDSDWKDASSISSDALAAGLVFARADTTKLMGALGDPGLVETLFAGFLGQSATSLSAKATAGPASIQVTPLAVCAISANPSATRNLPAGLPAEKIEYGFRRGVSYNLLALGPSAAAATAYLVDPIAPGNATHAAANFTAAAEIGRAHV